ncbi:MAG: hypothetical protein HXX11_15120 [Desulfuromonadales bacterium]|nr:hypothetical protein [Desulfuromonadales bacterium]
MLKISACCLAILLWVPSLVCAANGAFQVNSDSVSLPDGTVMTTAPKDGKSILSGSGAPSIVANIGDFYIDTANNRLYGPYAGSWGAGVSLVGPQGLKGDKGDTGATGPQGGSGLSVIDGAGKNLGVYMGQGNSYVNILFLANGNIYEMDASQNIWAFPSSTIFYTVANCSGTKYSNSGLFHQRIFAEGGKTSVGQPLYKTSNEVPFQINYLSMSNSGGCNNGSGSMLVTTVQVVGVIPSQPVGPITIQ